MQPVVGLETADRIMELVGMHEKYRTKQCINLRADENYTSPRVRSVLASDFCHRNTSPDPKFIYRGTKYLNRVYDLTVELGKKLFKADYLNVFAPTGHSANIIVFFAFCKPGDKVLVLAPEHGGYGGMASTSLPQSLGLETLYFPFDYDTMRIDVDRTIELLKKEKPSLVIFGSTYFLFPQPVKELAEASHRYGIPVAYDGAHVIGLIAGGEFQDPLHEGADVLFGSTMKTLAGPPGGIILTNNREIDVKLTEATWYRGVTAPQWNRIAALGVVFAEALEWGREYARQVVRNSRALATACHQRGVSVMYEHQKFTSSHTFLLNVGGLDQNVVGRASEKAAALEGANIIIDDRGRVGTGEVTRLGMKEGEMEQIADMMADAVLDKMSHSEIRERVLSLRSKFGIAFAK